MQVFDFEQYSPEYWIERRGCVAASEAGRICTPKKMELGAGAESYINELIADVMAYTWPPPMDDKVTQAMRDGIAFEPENRVRYELETDRKVKQVGFCKTDCGRFGCSPDGLVGEDGGLELKHPKPATQIAYVRAGTLPDEYKAQVHMSLIVTGRKWWDFYSVSFGMPSLLVRVEPSEYTEKLRQNLEKFWTKYQAALSFVRGREAAPLLDSETECPF